MKISSASYKDFAEKILEAIKDEPLLNDEILIPKIITLAKLLQLNVASNNYKNIDSPTEYQKRLRQLEIKEFEKQFWQREFKKNMGEAVFKEYCQKLDEIRDEF